MVFDLISYCVTVKTLHFMKMDGSKTSTPNRKSEYFPRKFPDRWSREMKTLSKAEVSDAVKVSCFYHEVEYLGCKF